MRLPAPRFLVSLSRRPLAFSALVVALTLPVAHFSQAASPEIESSAELTLESSDYSDLSEPAAEVFDAPLVVYGLEVRISTASKKRRDSTATPPLSTSPTAQPNPATASATLVPSATATGTPMPSTSPTPTKTRLTEPSPSVTGTATPSPTVTPTSTATASPVPIVGRSVYFGVNVSGAEFGDNHLPGTPWTDYIYAADGSRNSYFASKGLRLVRVPFLWERVQPTAMGDLSAADIAGLRSMLDACAAAGQVAVLDLHNYGRYYGAPLSAVDAAKLADVWRKVAQQFQGHPALYGYELMNEPHDMPSGSWPVLAQAAADAIREVDTQAWVLVPGDGWQSAGGWRVANEQLDVRDGTGRLLYAAHVYFDHDSSGAYSQSYDAEGAYPDVGVDRIAPFISWLQSHGKRGILTEYGIPDNDPRWLTVLSQFLDAVEAEPRLQGGTYWSSGPWWGGYPLSVEPQSGQDRPQMSVLATHPWRS